MTTDYERGFAAGVEAVAVGIEHATIGVWSWTRGAVAAEARALRAPSPAEDATPVGGRHFAGLAPLCTCGHAHQYAAGGYVFMMCNEDSCSCQHYSPRAPASDAAPRLRSRGTIPLSTLEDMDLSAPAPTATGGRCENCSGRGYRTWDNRPDEDCISCHGTGRSPSTPVKEK